MAGDQYVCVNKVAVQLKKYILLIMKWHGSIWHICAAMTTYPILTIFTFIHLVLPYCCLLTLANGGKVTCAFKQLIS
ncbi:hypothetical protein ACJX0J_015792, partial [Zea mays]